MHCATGSAICPSATAVKFGQTQPSPSASPDVLPDEPGGYSGFQGLFGHRYVAPQIGAGPANVTHNGFQVTNADGNLVDENGNQINGAFLTNHPGFPGLRPDQRLADARLHGGHDESGLPVVNGYIADIHGNENIPGVAACKGSPAALGSGDPCYVAQAQYYNDAFGTFFQRLAADGITPQNTVFVLSPDEGDHEAGANVGRAIQPTPANCDGAKVYGDTVTPDVLCTYPAGTFGELSGNITGLLATQRRTPRSSAGVGLAPEFYVTGNPACDDPQVRTLEQDLGKPHRAQPVHESIQPIANYLATPEEGIVHMVNADPARTPTVAMFARPDYFLSRGDQLRRTQCVSVEYRVRLQPRRLCRRDRHRCPRVGGPGVKHLGLDGGPERGPQLGGAGQRPGHRSQRAHQGNLDGRDRHPADTLYLAGLKDDYEHDGRVITEVLTNPNHALAQPGVSALGACYKQLNSSVGELGTDVLIASTKAAGSTSPSDAKFKVAQVALRSLDKLRDKVALTIKDDLEAAAFGNQTIRNAGAELGACQAVIGVAKHLAAVG